MIHVIWDETRRAKVVAEGRNDWFRYVEEMLDCLGAAHGRLAPDRVAEACPGEGDVIFLPGDEVSPACGKALGEALARGCRVVGFATRGADDLFGLAPGKGGYTAPDFTYAGTLRLTEAAALPGLEPAPLPLFASVRAVVPRDARVLGTVEAGGTEYPGLTRRGGAYYFAFDLPQSVWSSTIGKPVLKPSNGFPVGRTPDTRILPLDYDTRIAYNDYYLYLLQAILYEAGTPLLHRLPPMADGQAPDLLLYCGGDDDACDPQITLDAFKAMNGVGLPYHVNLMPKGPDGNAFALDGKAAAQLRSPEREFSLHYDFVSGFDACDEAGYRRQFDRYLKEYGVSPVCQVAHCAGMMGWTEHYRYMAELGIRGDHFHGAEVDLEDPGNINAFNLYGFAFGTAFPAFVYDDAAHGNERIRFLNLPACYYEPRLRGAGDDATREKLRRCLEDAIAFGRPVQLFLHPHYVSGHMEKQEIVLGAVRELLGACEERGARVLKDTPDGVTLWWLDRADSRLEPGAADVTRVHSAARRGLIVRFPWVEGERFLVNGVPAATEERMLDGLRWRLVSLPGAGDYEIRREA